MLQFWRVARIVPMTGFSSKILCPIGNFVIRIDNILWFNIHLFIRFGSFWQFPLENELHLANGLPVIWCFQGAVSIRKMVLPGMAIPMLNVELSFVRYFLFCSLSSLTGILGCLDLFDTDWDSGMNRDDTIYLLSLSCWYSVATRETLIT